MEKCQKCGFEYKSTYNYCPSCGEALSALAKQRDAIKLHNAGLIAVARLSQTSNSIEVQKTIKRFIDENKIG